MYRLCWSVCYDSAAGPFFLPISTLSLYVGWSVACQGVGVEDETDGAAVAAGALSADADVKVLAV